MLRWFIKGLERAQKELTFPRIMIGLPTGLMIGDILQTRKRKREREDEEDRYAYLSTYGDDL
jgi:hypothetical protein